MTRVTLIFPGSLAQTASLMTASLRKLLEIFRAGRHTDMAGRSLEFSESHLQASAEAYDPQLHEAPITVGHPEHNKPAYGWIKALEYADGKLQAEPHQVEPQFAEMVNAGRFKKRSASFYPPNHPSNPKPGVYYLKHVGFLGAAAPGVKGLKDAAFAAGDDQCIEVEFSESAFADSFLPRSIAGVFRRMREYLIAKEDMETADKIIPDYMTDSDFYEPVKESTSYAEPTPKATPEEKTVELTPEQKAEQERKEAEFAEREQKLKEDEERIAADKARTRKSEITSFVENLVKDGRILPKQELGLIEFMDSVEANIDGVIEFAEKEGGETVKREPKTFLRDFLQELPKVVDYAERSPAEQDTAVAQDYDLPPGYSVNPEKMDIHNRALAYQEAHEGVDYEAAVNIVTKQRGN